MKAVGGLVFSAFAIGTSALSAGARPLGNFSVNRFLGIGMVVPHLNTAIGATSLAENQFTIDASGIQRPRDRADRGIYVL